MTPGDDCAVFSIDVEDWYQGVEIPLCNWEGKENRIQIGLEAVLSILQETGTRGTFFALGWIAEKYPEMVARVAAAGHEIGSHGYCHQRVSTLTPQEFRQDIRRTKEILEKIVGKPVRAYRAPFFSIVQTSLWALPILREEGYEYDCSIAPVKNWHYGIENSPEDVYRIKELGLIEFPISTFRFLGRKVGIGGAYFRVFPYRYTAQGLGRLLSARRPAMFYAHPWEYDSGHPTVKMDFRMSLTHYFNLKATRERTRKLLQQYRFRTLSEVIDSLQAGDRIPSISIEALKN